MIIRLLLDNSEKAMQNLAKKMSILTLMIVAHTVIRTIIRIHIHTRILTITHILIVTADVDSGKFF